MVVQGTVLVIAAFIGGTLNAVAGGGSFFTFPALIAAGVPPIAANATSTVALWPGSIASTVAYRNDVHRTRLTVLLSIASLAGGIIGAFLLLRTPTATFQKLIPWLLLVATALFGLGPMLTKRFRRASVAGAGVGDDASPQSPGALVGLTAVQFVIAVYGGFFGGGIGILMLAALGIMGLTNIHEMNGLKTLFAACINGVAVLIFIVGHAVYWPQAVIMLIAGIAGGYLGAAGARRIPPQYVRVFVIVVGCLLTVYFFVRA